MKKVLIVIDAQNDFITGSLGSQEAVDVVPKIVEKIKNFDGDAIIYTQDTHCSNYLETQEGKKLPIKHCIYDTDGWKIENSIAEAGKEKTSNIIYKDTFGACLLPYNVINIYSEFDNGKDLIIQIVGYDLDICVISNALLLKTFFPEARIVVDTDCCAATSKEGFDAACRILNSNHVVAIGG